MAVVFFCIFSNLIVMFDKLSVIQFTTAFFTKKNNLTVVVDYFYVKKLNASIIKNLKNYFFIVTTKLKPSTILTKILL